MLILKSQQWDDDALIKYACTLSSKTGEMTDKLLHWSFGPLMTMQFDANATNYLFSAEPVPLHWDGAFFKEPTLLLFYCTESEGAGGETLFSNTEHLWKSLTGIEQNLCRQIKVRYKTKKMAHYGGEIEVPLVQQNPRTGQTILRVAERVETDLNPVDLTILGPQGSETLFKFLVDRLYSSEFMYEHTWSAGDLVICDNFTYLHGRKGLGQNRKRTFKRIQIL